MDNKYYEYLTELELQTNFTLEELNKKYKELSRKYHPDKHAKADETLQKLAEEKMKKINEAYSFLKENYGKNSSNNGNNNYREYENYYYENENYSKEDYYFSNEEELNYFGEFLPRLKKIIEDSLKNKIKKIIEELDSVNRFNILTMESFISKIDEFLEKNLKIFSNFSSNLFFDYIEDINKLKTSDIVYLDNISTNEFVEISKFALKYNAVENFISNKYYKDLAYIQLIRARYFYFVEEIFKIEDEIKNRVDIFCKNVGNIIDETRKIPFIGEILIQTNIDSVIINELENFKISIKNIYIDVPNKIFKAIKKVIYIGIEDYEKEALISEAYYRANIDPAFNLSFYRNTDENLKNLLRLFPNEKNNVLVKLYMFYKEGKIEDIKKLESEIAKIELNSYFEQIVNSLFKDFINKKESFFNNIQLLFNKQAKKDMLLLLKDIPKKLEDNIEIKFWGKYNEIDDFKELMQKYYFINKEENKKFLDEVYPYIDNVLKYYNFLEEKRKENQQIEDLIEVYNYIEDLKKNEKIFDFYSVTEIENEKERKRKTYEISDFYLKNLNKLRNIKSKFLKYKDKGIFKEIIIKKFAEKIENKIEEIKFLISGRIKFNQAKLDDLDNKKENKSQINMYKNIIIFFKELENF